MTNEISQQSYPAYPDPRMDPWDYQAALSGFKNGEEFKKEYFAQAKKAAVSGVAAGTGVFAAGFGLSAGVIMGAPELPALLGVVGRFAKNVGIKAWEVAKSAWSWAMGTAATPQGLEVIKQTTECLDAIVDGSPLPTGFTGQACLTARNLAEGINDLRANPQETKIEENY